MQFQSNNWLLVTGPGYLEGNGVDIAQNEVNYVCIPPKVSIVVKGKFHTNCTYKSYTDVNKITKLAKEVEGSKILIEGAPDSGKSFYVEHISKLNESIVGNVDTMQPIAGHPMTQSITKRKKILLQDEKSNEVFSPHNKFNKEWFEIAKKIAKKADIINIPGGGIPKEYIQELEQMTDRVIRLNKLTSPKTIYDRRTYTYWMTIKDNDKKIEINEVIGDNKLKSAPKRYKERYIGQVVGLFEKGNFKGVGVVRSIENNWIIETYVDSAKIAKLSPLRIMSKQFNSIKESLKSCKPSQHN